MARSPEAKRAYDRHYRRLARAALIAAGLCVECGREPVDRFRRCLRCRRRDAERFRRRHAQSRVVRAVSVPS